jgi:hypothetical protein
MQVVLRKNARAAPPLRKKNNANKCAKLFAKGGELHYNGIVIEKPKEVGECKQRRWNICRERWKA